MGQDQPRRSRGERWVFAAVAVLLGVFASVNAVLIVLGVITVRNGAGEAVTSPFWRIFVAAISLGFGAVCVGAAATGAAEDTGTSSSAPDREGLWLEGDAVAEIVDGDLFD